jgi:hypothetical protein
MLMASPLTTVEILRTRSLELGGDLYTTTRHDVFGVREGKRSGSLSERQLMEGLLGWFIDGADPG